MDLKKFKKDQLIQGLTGAAVIAAGNYNSSQYAQMIANMVGLKYGRDQELETNNLGVRFMISQDSIHKPWSKWCIYSKENTNGNRQPEFLQYPSKSWKQNRKIKGSDRPIFRSYQYKWIASCKSCFQSGK